MASLNPLTRELVFKIVFYGPGLGGKTTTLQHIHSASEPENRGNLVSLATPSDRTIFFDFLPLRVERIRDLNVRLQLFTVPGQVYYASTRKLVLTGADAVVFVADSQNPRLDANAEVLEDLEKNLHEHERDLATFPIVFQWNKRDLPDIATVDEMNARFNPKGLPSFETVASSGRGVFETLEAITKLAIKSYLAELPAAKPEATWSKDSLPHGDGMIADAIRSAAESIRPEIPHRVHRTEPSPSMQMRTTETPVVGSLRAVTEAQVTMARSSTGARSEGPPPTRALPEVRGGISLVPLWNEAERFLATQIERHLAASEYDLAIRILDEFVLRVLAATMAPLGPSEAPRDPALACTLLGLDGRRFIRMRQSVRRVRMGHGGTVTDAMECYLFALELHRAR